MASKNTRTRAVKWRSEYLSQEIKFKTVPTPPPHLETCSEPFCIKPQLQRSWKLGVMDGKIDQIDRLTDRHCIIQTIKINFFPLLTKNDHIYSPRFPKYGSEKERTTRDTEKKLNMCNDKCLSSDQYRKNTNETDVYILFSWSLSYCSACFLKSWNPDDRLQWAICLPGIESPLRDWRTLVYLLYIVLRYR